MGFALFVEKKFRPEGSKFDQKVAFVCDVLLDNCDFAFVSSQVISAALLVLLPSISLIENGCKEVGGQRFYPESKRKNEMEVTKRTPFWSCAGFVCVRR